MNIQVKEIFKDVIPEFKSSDREKKLKILLKDGHKSKFKKMFSLWRRN